MRQTTSDTSSPAVSWVTSFSSSLGVTLEFVRWCLWQLFKGCVQSSNTCSFPQVAQSSILSIQYHLFYIGVKDVYFVIDRDVFWTLDFPEHETIVPGKVVHLMCSCEMSCIIIRECNIYSWPLVNMRLLVWLLVCLHSQGETKKNINLPLLYFYHVL